MYTEEDKARAKRIIADFLDEEDIQFNYLSTPWDDYREEQRYPLYVCIHGLEPLVPRFWYGLVTFAFEHGFQIEVA